MLSYNGKDLGIKAYIALGAILVVLTVIVGAISHNVGYLSKLNSEAITTMAENKQSLDGEYAQRKSDVDKIKSEISSQQELLNAFNDYKTNKANLDVEISQKTEKVSSLTSTSAELDGTIALKNEEIEKLKNIIVKTGEAPITLPAGEFTVGSDIPAGRYSASGSSNLLIYSSTGSNKVNTILGNSIVGSGNYVCTLSDGDIVNSHAKTTFTPIK